MDSKMPTCTEEVRFSEEEARRERGSALVRKYFAQLTRGCGRQGCPNRHCLSCAEGPGPLDPTRAALQSLELAQSSVCALCDELPPFLHPLYVSQLIAEAEGAGDTRRLEKEVAAVFSSSDALSRSFLATGGALQQAAAELRVDESQLCGVDLEGMAAAYQALLGLQSREVVAALMNATESLLCRLQVAKLVVQPEFVTAGPGVRQFFVLLANPLLLEPQYQRSTLLPLLSLLSSLPAACSVLLTRWWSHLPADALRRIVSVVHQFLTVRLFYTQRIDDAVIAGTKVLGMLYDANEAAIAAGWRRGGGGAAGQLDYHAFYNDAVNQEVNLREDYRRWKSERSEFSFCRHAYVLEPASKSRVLMFDATAQMTHEFEGAILRSLFVGATSPYLVLKVRRAHLIQDTMLRVSQQHQDLKKPLKVQFVAEEGIDEGGVQKEFFQLIMAQIFDGMFGMFVYDDERRVFWFNRSSLESNREFELIGILLGVAIYNGIILDVRFPHVVYKKLMRDSLGLDDLKRAFPGMGSSLQQLLDYEPAEEVEDTFGLCMQVTYEEFGQKLSYDLVPGGGEVSVTQHNRVEYVRLYTRYLLEDSVRPQFDAFLRGFHSVCGGDCLQLFRWEELELLICGSPDLDFEALERVAQYDDGYSRDHPSIALLWEAIHELPLDLKKKFLFFSTGSDRVPIKGLGNLNFVISRNGADEERLPSAHTCFNHLLLPEYKTKQQLLKQLLKAISDTEGFHII